MKNIGLLILIGLMIISLTNCEKDSEDKIHSKISQRIYFQYDYINFAWGYKHTGWLIDSSGNVYCYKKPENWVKEDSLGFISSIDMDNNILETDSLCFTIDKEELDAKISLINKASEGVISEPVNEMYDAGRAVFLGYLYNSKTKIYKTVLLKQIGDFRIDNSSPESVELYEWLKSIHNAIYNNFNQQI